MKYTYIKQDVSGYYIEFDEMFDPKLYNNIGRTYDDFIMGYWVLLSPQQVEFHKENPDASVKEVWYMKLTPVPPTPPPPPIPPRTIDDAKSEMIQKIDAYDKSSNVNGFTINEEQDGWFTPEERSNYKSSIDAAKLLGVSALTFFVGDMLLEVTPTQAEYMLAQVQLYADQCFIVTKTHKLEVEALETIEEVDEYPYTEGYPQKINFTYPIPTEEAE